MSGDVWGHHTQFHTEIGEVSPEFNWKSMLMSREMSLSPMDDAAETLFLKVAQKETEGHQNTYDLTVEFLEYLGFPTIDAVKRAADEIRGYAHHSKWDGGVCLMRIEDGKLVCRPYVKQAWDDYQKRLVATQ